MTRTTTLTVIVSALALAATAFAQSQPVPTQPTPSVRLIQEVVSTPNVAATYQVGQTATVQFRVLLSTGQTTSNLFALPVVVNTVELQSQQDVTAATTTCQMVLGTCTVKANKPSVLLITVWQNGVFGLHQVALSFANMRSNFPATIDVTASLAQGQEGVSGSLIATSPIWIEGATTVTATTLYADSADSVNKSIYFPNGIAYGQRIEINTDTMYPLSFRGRRYFQVQFFGPSGNLVAQGFGNSVSLTEWKSIDAVIDDNNDLVVTLDSPFSSSVDYTVTLLRGDQFRIELAQNRGEIFAYASGSKTKLIFNRGSLGDSSYLLPNGFYTVNVNQLDRSNSIRWNQAQADALGNNGQYLLR
jgi:hypothetical protein